MEDRIDTYRVPEGFNPWKALDAIRGVTDALHHFLTEGRGSPEHQMTYQDRASLDGLLGVLQSQVHALHDYFTAIGDSTALRLPLNEDDFDKLHLSRNQKDEIREFRPPVYLTKRR